MLARLGCFFALVFLLIGRPASADTVVSVWNPTAAQEVIVTTFTPGSPVALNFADLRTAAGANADPIVVRIYGSSTEIGASPNPPGSGEWCGSVTISAAATDVPNFPNELHVLVAPRPRFSQPGGPHIDVIDPSVAFEPAFTVFQGVSVVSSIPGNAPADTAADSLRQRTRLAAAVLHSFGLALSPSEILVGKVHRLQARGVLESNGEFTGGNLYASVTATANDIDLVISVHSPRGTRTHRVPIAAGRERGAAGSAA